MRDRIRTWASSGLLLALLTVLGLVSLTWNLIAVPLFPLLSPERGRTIGRAVIAACYRAFWTLASLSGMLKIESSALDRFRDEAGLIIVANHPSMLDALILVARLPRSACIMKAEPMKNLFLGSGARLARYIQDDSARSMVRLTVQDLKRGGQLVIFLEGTRTTVRPVNPFRPGVTLIDKVANAPIQTVFIDTDSPYLGKGWPIWKLHPLPVLFTVRLGERFAPSPDLHALPRTLEDYFVANLVAPEQQTRCS